MTAFADRDERTLAVENAGFRWAYQVVSFGLLILVGYRSVARSEAAWDLIGLVVLGGVVAAIYQWSHGALTKRRLMNGLAGVLVAATIASAVVWLGR